MNRNRLVRFPNPWAASSQPAPLLAAVLLAWPAVLSAQNWSDIVASPRPDNHWSGLGGMAMAYDGARRECIAFDTRFSTGLPETWSWNGSSWTQLTPVTTPPPRSAAAMAYDPSRDRLVLAGGFGYQGLPLGDTWEWDGTNWSDRTPMSTANQLPPMHSHAGSYAGNGTMLVVAGWDGTGTGNTRSWSWDGAVWTDVGSCPPVVYQPAACYDSARARVVLFGGMSASLAQLNDTWEWDGLSWALQSPASKPPIRWRPGLSFDSARGRSVLYGGTNAINGNAGLNDTWAWNGSNWAQLQTTHAPIAIAGQGAYDAARDEIVKHRGSANNTTLATWLFRGEAQLEAYGASCGGLQLGGNTPVVGTVWQLTVDHLEPRTSGFAGIVYGGRGPAVPLTNFGLNATGCFAHVGVPTLFTLLSFYQGTSTSVSITIPPSLSGIRLAAEAFGETTGNPGGFYFSNGVEGTFGL